MTLSRPSGERRPEMDVAQFVGEGGEKRRAALLHQLLTDREFRRGRQMPAAPGAELHQHGNKLDRLFGQAVEFPSAGGRDHPCG